jgi:hypothetical protein
MPRVELSQMRRAIRRNGAIVSLYRCGDCGEVGEYVGIGQYVDPLRKPVECAACGGETREPFVSTCCNAKSCSKCAEVPW